MNEDIICKLENVSKIYIDAERKIEVLKKINFTVKRGDVIGIFGPSGSGKTTLLNIIGTLDKPSEGKVIWEGKDITNYSDRELSLLRNKKIGFVFQFFYLLNELKVWENVILPLILNGYDINEAKREAIFVLESLGLGDKIYFYPDKLSGGEKQRVAIARAIVNKPVLILADEPTGNLDKENAQNILKIFLKLNKERNISIIFVSHNEEFSRFFKKNYKLVNGFLKEL